MREHLVIAIALAACFDPPAEDGPAINSRVEYYDLPGSFPPRIDVLLVIDNTTAMAPYSSQLSELATYLDATLTWPDGALPSARVAVTTTDGAGALRQSAATSDGYLETGLDARFERTSNFTGTLTDALAALFDVGTQGTSTVTPLAAMQLALAAHPELNRENALLGVVTIAASDDASPSDPFEYVNALKQSKSDPTYVIVSGIYQQPAPRLDAFHQAFPNRNRTEDIDSTDYSGAVTMFGQLFRVPLGGRCFYMPADADPVTPGLQFDCALAAFYVDDTSEPLPQCSDDGPTRCFEIVRDTTTCGEFGYGVIFARGYPGYHQPAIRGQCVVN